MTYKELGIENDMPGWLSKDQPKWHRVLFDMWRDMHRRCKDPSSKNYSNYKDCFIDESLNKFSNYVNLAKSQLNFEEFCLTCHEISWSFDKDIKVSDNKNYYPEFMSLVTKSDNSKERNKRRGCLMSNVDIRRKLMKSIIGISKDNFNFIIFNSITEASQKGFDSSNISKCLKKKAKSHKGFQWFYLTIIEL